MKSLVNRLFPSGGRLQVREPKADTGVSAALGPSTDHLSLDVFCEDRTERSSGVRVDAAILVASDGDLLEHSLKLCSEASVGLLFFPRADHGSISPVFYSLAQHGLVADDMVQTSGPPGYCVIVRKHEVTASVAACANAATLNRVIDTLNRDIILRILARVERVAQGSLPAESLRDADFGSQFRGMLLMRFPVEAGTLEATRSGIERQLQAVGEAVSKGKADLVRLEGEINSLRSQLTQLEQLSAARIQQSKLDTRVTLWRSRRAVDVAESAALTALSKAVASRTPPPRQTATTPNPYLVLFPWDYVSPNVIKQVSPPTLPGGRLHRTREYVSVALARAHTIVVSGSLLRENGTRPAPNEAVLAVRFLDADGVPVPEPVVAARKDTEYYFRCNFQIPDRFTVSIEVPDGAVGVDLALQQAEGASNSDGDLVLWGPLAVSFFWISLNLAKRVSLEHDGASLVVPKAGVVLAVPEGAIGLDAVVRDRRATVRAQRRVELEDGTERWDDVVQHQSRDGRLHIELGAESPIDLLKLSRSGNHRPIIELPLRVARSMLAVGFEALKQPSGVDPATLEELARVCLGCRSARPGDTLSSTSRGDMAWWVWDTRTAERFATEAVHVWLAVHRAGEASADGKDALLVWRGYDKSGNLLDHRSLGVNQSSGYGPYSYASTRGPQRALTGSIRRPEDLAWLALGVCVWSAVDGLEFSSLAFAGPPPIVGAMRVEPPDRLLGDRGFVVAELGSGDKLALSPNNWTAVILGMAVRRLVLDLTQVSNDTAWRGALAVCSHPIANELRVLVAKAIELKIPVAVYMTPEAPCPAQLLEVAAERHWPKPDHPDGQEDSDLVVSPPSDSELSGEALGVGEHVACDPLACPAERQTEDANGVVSQVAMSPTRTDREG